MIVNVVKLSDVCPDHFSTIAIISVSQLTSVISHSNIVLHCVGW